MGHDGVIDEYLRYGVSKEQEREWRREKQRNPVSQRNRVSDRPMTFDV
jgi:hypothetical protein